MIKKTKVILRFLLGLFADYSKRKSEKLAQVKQLQKRQLSQPQSKKSDEPVSDLLSEDDEIVPVGRLLMPRRLIFPDEY